MELPLLFLNLYKNLGFIEREVFGFQTQYICRHNIMELPLLFLNPYENLGFIEREVFDLPD